MKHRTRYALALTLVATTLCAGRLFSSDQNAKVENRPMTEKLVARLTRVLGRTICHSPLVVQRRTTAPIIPRLVTIETDRRHCIQLLPFELRLPPPSV